MTKKTEKKQEEAKSTKRVPRPKNVSFLPHARKQRRSKNLEP